MIRKMRGIDLLDDVDADLLANYCIGLARSERLGQDADAGGMIDDRIYALLQAQDRLNLSYADKLGLTPTGRARLARKSAEKTGADPSAGMFG